MNIFLEKKLRDAIRDKVFVSSESTYIASAGPDPEHWIFDFRRVILQPHILDAYAESFFERFKDKYPFQVCGLEVAAIPIVSAIVMKSLAVGTPVNGFFIRKSRKKSGLLNMIEGEVQDAPIILVDDIMNSGSSFMRQIEVLESIKKETGKGQVTAVFSILRFSPISRYTQFHEKNISIDSLFSLDEFSDLLTSIPRPQAKPILQNHFKTVWLWHGTAPSLEHVRPKSSAVFDGEYIYTITDDGKVVCLESQSGNVRWTFTIPFNPTRRNQFSQPLLQGERIIFGSYDGNVYALDTATGTRVWVCFDADWVGGSPCSGGGETIFVPLEFGFFRKQSSLVCIDSKDGSKRWHTPYTDGIAQSPAYSKKHGLVFTGTSKGVVHAFSAKTGKPVWQTELPLPLSIVTAPLVVDDMDIVIFTGLAPQTTELSGVFALDLRDGSIRWQLQDFYYGSYGTPVREGDYVLITGLDKSLRAIDIQTGNVVWKTPFPARVFSSPVGGKIRNQRCLYLGTNDSILYEIDIQSGAILGASMFTERITNNAILDERRQTIFVPTYANEIFCITPK